VNMGSHSARVHRRYAVPRRVWFSFACLQARHSPGWAPRFGHAASEGRSGMKHRIGRALRGGDRLCSSIAAPPVARWPHDRVRTQGRPAPLPARWPQRAAVEARRAIRVRHPPPPGADRHQPAWPGQAPGHGRDGVLRRYLRPSLPQSADLGRVRPDVRHVRLPGRITRVHHRAVPPGLGAF
jgi:hypothetical protein